MKKLINIRGACGTGKTETVRQWCRKKGFHVEYIKISAGELPVSIVESEKAIVLGDYDKTNNCTGTDALHCNGKVCGKKEICELVKVLCRDYRPDYVIYEHMLSSQVCQFTTEVANTAEKYGYEYVGIQFWTDSAERIDRLERRSGAKVGLKNFHVHDERTTRATELLREKGYNVIKLNTTDIAKEDMWRIVENAIQKT
jgi:hypothetical protein